MSDETPPVGTGAPAAPATPPVVPPAAAAPPVAPPAPPPAPAAPPGEPDWLPGRLEQAKRARDAELIASLGVSSLDEVRAAVTAKKTADATPRTPEDRIAALERDLTAYKQTLSTQAATELASLTADQREAVKLVAGDDPSRQLSAITALRRTWTATVPAAAAPAATPAVATTAPAATPAAPATTAPPASSAPAPNGTTSPPDHKAEYARLKNTNPYAAAQYLNLHADAIYPHN